MTTNIDNRDEQTPVPLADPASPNASNPPVPTTINMPDHWVRQTVGYQLFVRLARPTLDWITDAAVLWNLIVLPATGKFDAAATGLTLAWAAAVYGFKFAEKVKGVA